MTMTRVRHDALDLRARRLDVLEGALARIDGLAASFAGAYRLTDPGKARASELVAKEAAA